MKTNKKVTKSVKAEAVKFQPISKVLKEDTAVEGRGRISRFPFVQIKKGYGMHCGSGTSVSEISPLVSYFNKQNNAHLKTKTVIHEGAKQVFVYNPAQEKKELAAA